MSKTEKAAEWMKVDDLIPWAQNPRVNDLAVSEVSLSIKRFGFGAPIIARKADNMVIAGHTRLKAAKKLGLEHVPVRFLDLDLVDAKLLALADNKLNEVAEWDEQQLADIMQDFDADALEGLGWSDEELKLLLEDEPEIQEPVAENSNDDDFEYKEPAEPDTKPGEVLTLGRHTLHCGDCIEVMKGLDENSVDAICTDPPYGIGFMGKDWDCAVPGDAFAEQALRVLKPGGHIIAFAATRTVHRLTVSLEDAGFEIRDQIAWCQWQGFPKSLDVSKSIDKHFGAERTETIGPANKVPNAKSVNAHFINAAGQRSEEDARILYARTKPKTAKAIYWNGYGTALKPAYEPAVLARKPLDGTVCNNVLTHETGGLNIDGCRIEYGDTAWPGPSGDVVSRGDNPKGGVSSLGTVMKGQHHNPVSEIGRWPANLYHCPKPSRGEREAGCDDLDAVSGSDAVNRKPDTAGVNNPRAGAGRTASTVHNHHPTVKPLKLMEWLARLILPPSGGVILEPFCGSGTTLAAVERIGSEHSCIAIEMEPKYCDIIRARWEHNAKQ